MVALVVGATALVGSGCSSPWPLGDRGTSEVSGEGAAAESSLAVLVERLKSDDAREQRTAAKAILALTSDEAAGEVRRHLRPDVPMIASLLLEEIRSRRDPRFSEDVLKLLAGSSRQLEEAAEETLAALPPPQWVPKTAEFSQSWRLPPEARIRLARVAARSKEPETAALLVRFLEHPEDRVRQAGLDGLGRLAGRSFASPAEATSWWQAAKRLSPDQWRFSASDSSVEELSELVAKLTQRIVSTEVALLESRFELAIRGVGPFKESELLEQALRHEYPEVQKRALGLLFSLEQSRATGLLGAVRYLASGDGPEEVRLAAIQILGKLGGSEDTLLLGELVKPGQRRAIRRGALQALSDRGGAEAVEVLAGAVPDLDAAIRLEAIRNLGRLRAVEALRVLHEALPGEADPDCLGALVDTLGIIGSPASVGHLLGILEQDPEERIAWKTVNSLGLLRDPRALEVLERFLSRKEPKLRQVAVEAMERIGQAASVAALARNLLEDDDAGVRRRAASALKTLAREEALPALMAALSDPEQEVSSAAWEAALWVGHGRFEMLEGIFTVLEEEQKFPEKAETLLLELGTISLREDSPPEYRLRLKKHATRLGKLFRAKGDFHKAALFLSQAVDQVADVPEKLGIELLLADSIRAMGREEEAWNRLDKLSLQAGDPLPEKYPLLLLKAELEHLQGRYAEAERTLDRVLSASGGATEEIRQRARDLLEETRAAAAGAAKEFREFVLESLRLLGQPQTGDRRQELLSVLREKEKTVARVLVEILESQDTSLWEPASEVLSEFTGLAIRVGHQSSPEERQGAVEKVERWLSQ